MKRKREKERGEEGKDTGKKRTVIFLLLGLVGGQHFLTYDRARRSNRSRIYK